VGVGVKVDGVEDKVENIGDQVHCVREQVQVVIHGVRGPSSQLRSLLISILSDGKQARVAAKEAALIIQHTANDIDEVKCSYLPTNLSSPAARA
jgi:hypothetical protein